MYTPVSNDQLDTETETNDTLGTTMAVVLEADQVGDLGNSEESDLGDHVNNDPPLTDQNAFAVLVSDSQEPPSPFVTTDTHIEPDQNRHRTSTLPTLQEICQSKIPVLTHIPSRIRGEVRDALSKTIWKAVIATVESSMNACACPPFSLRNFGHPPKYEVKIEVRASYVRYHFTPEPPGALGERRVHEAMARIYEVGIVSRA